MEEGLVIDSDRHEQAAAVHTEQVPDAVVSHIIDVSNAEIEWR